jgi:DNA primase
MSSHARLLWEPLPDGALKRQLLGEIAGLVQLDTADLQDVWLQAAARAHPPAPAQPGPAHPRRSAARAPAPPATPMATGRRRAAPSSRSDHAARLLLSHMDFIDALSHEDNALLCAQPAPHGALFAWIEAQFHEHGALPWAVLRESLRGHPCESLAERVMTGAHAQTEGDTRELQQELRSLLNRMLVEQLKQQESAAIAAAPGDPAALERYRSLQTRRLALERGAPPAP